MWIPFSFLLSCICACSQISAGKQESNITSFDNGVSSIQLPQPYSIPDAHTIALFVKHEGQTNKRHQTLCKAIAYTLTHGTPTQSKISLSESIVHSGGSIEYIFTPSGTLYWIRFPSADKAIIEQTVQHITTLLNVLNTKPLASMATSIAHSLGYTPITNRDIEKWLDRQYASANTFIIDMPHAHTSYEYSIKQSVAAINTRGSISDKLLTYQTYTKSQYHPSIQFKATQKDEKTITLAIPIKKEDASPGIIRILEYIFTVETANSFHSILTEANLIIPHSIHVLYDTQTEELIIQLKLPNETTSYLPILTATWECLKNLDQLTDQSVRLLEQYHPSSMANLITKSMNGSGNLKIILEYINWYTSLYGPLTALENPQIIYNNSLEAEKVKTILSYIVEISKTWRLSALITNLDPPEYALPVKEHAHLFYITNAALVKMLLQYQVLHPEDPIKKIDMYAPSTMKEFEMNGWYDSSATALQRSYQIEGSSTSKTKGIVIPWRDMYASCSTNIYMPNIDKEMRSTLHLLVQYIIHSNSYKNIEKMLNIYQGSFILYPVKTGIGMVISTPYWLLPNYIDIIKEQLDAISFDKEKIIKTMEQAHISLQDEDVEKMLELKLNSPLFQNNQGLIWIIGDEEIAENTYKSMRELLNSSFIPDIDKSKKSFKGPLSIEPYDPLGYSTLLLSLPIIQSKITKYLPHHPHRISVEPYKSECTILFQAEDIFSHPSVAQIIQYQIPLSLESNSFELIRQSTLSTLHHSQETLAYHLSFYPAEETAKNNWDITIQYLLTLPFSEWILGLNNLEIHASFLPAEMPISSYTTYV